MSIFLTVISVIAAVFSCVCAGLTMAEYRAYKRALKAMQPKPDQSQPAGYQDLSAGPRYREYGDLSSDDEFTAYVKADIERGNWI